MMNSSHRPKTNILYVDDDRDNLESFKAVFRREYNVYLANSAKEAMAVLEQNTIHVLITDQRMPGMTGSELLENLADKYPDMLRYILTGFSDFDPLVRALNDGKLQGYFSKPLDPEIVKNRIENGMTRYYLQRENEGLYRSLKESEQRVRDQLAELEQVYSTAPVGLIVVDKDLRVIRINEKLAEIDGLPVLEHLGRLLDDIVPELIDQLRSIYQPVLKTGAPALNVPIHGTTRAMPGIERDWLGSYYPYTNNEGEITGVIGGVIEITELRQAEREIREARRFTENLLQTTNAMILVLDAEGRVKLMNPKVEELTGYASDELIGKSWFEDIVPRDIYSWVWEEFKFMMGSGTPHHLENPILTKTGAERIISWSNSIMEEKGARVGILSVGIDITKRKIAEEEKDRLAKQLQQAHKMEAIGNLAGGIAHDFNNILSVILGFTELAMTGIANDSPVRTELQQVITAGNRAKDLVTQILTIARKTDEEFKPIRVDVIAKEVLKFIRSSIPTSIEIQQHLASDSLIMANATQIHQVIMNLCTNAAQAMGENGGTLKVGLADTTIDTTSTLNKDGIKTGEYIELQIADTGVGIPPHIIGSIFEPYFTTKEPGEGTGIGLALVHSIVENRGGKVMVRSQPGEGTVFSIYLPITQKRTTLKEIEQEDLPAGSERILYIDDEDSITRLGNRILEGLGYRVTTRTSSIEALELFRKDATGFDLVITDMTMPQMSGDILCQELKKIRPDIPVLLCTGYSNKISPERAKHAGIDAVFSKPYTRSEIANVVKRILRNDPEPSPERPA